MIDACGRIATRTHDTTASYKRVYARLCHQSGAESIADGVPRIRAVITWWQMHDRAWAPATIRQYRAAIRAAGETLSSALDWRTVLNNLLSHAPAPRPRSAPRRTSARKRKSIPHDDLIKLADATQKAGDRTGALLAGMLLFGAVVGLRPSEWVNARISGGSLAIRSAKTTNQRGIAVREIALERLGDPVVGKLYQFLDVLNQEIGKAGWPRLYRRIAKRLYRICQSMKFRPICLYTVRHQAIANGKLVLDRFDVAALAGHVSIRTAATHYGRRRSGWRNTIVLLPTPATRAAVRVTTTTPPIFRSRRRPLGP